MNEKETAHRLAEKLTHFLTKKEMQEFYDLMADEAGVVGPLLSAVYAECYYRWPEEYWNVTNRHSSVEEAIKFVKNREEI